MNQKYRIPLVSIILTLFTSCNPVATGMKESSFGKNFKPGLPAEPSAPQATVGVSTGFKVSAGVGRLAGSEGSAKAAIMPNDRRLVGGQISGRFSISKTRVR